MTPASALANLSTPAKPELEELDDMLWVPLKSWKPLKPLEVFQEDPLPDMEPGTGLPDRRHIMRQDSKLTPRNSFHTYGFPEGLPRNMKYAPNRTLHDQRQQVMQGFINSLQGNQKALQREIRERRGEPEPGWIEGLLGLLGKDR